MQINKVIKMWQEVIKMNCLKNFMMNTKSRTICSEKNYWEYNFLVKVI